MLDVLKSQNFPGGHFEINASNFLYLSSGVICQAHASSTLFLIGFEPGAISTNMNMAHEFNHRSKEKVIELTIGKEESNLKELEFSSTILTLCPPFSSFPLG